MCNRYCQGVTAMNMSTNTSHNPFFDNNTTTVATAFGVPVWHFAVQHAPMVFTYTTVLRFGAALVTVQTSASGGHLRVTDVDISRCSDPTLAALALDEAQMRIAYLSVAIEAQVANALNDTFGDLHL